MLNNFMPRPSIRDITALLNALTALIYAIRGRHVLTSAPTTPSAARPRRAVPRPVPNDALYRLGKKIEREMKIPPRPDHNDPITGRRDPPGFYTINHYTGRPLRRK